MPKTIKKPEATSANGTGTFMPHRPEISVGIDRMMVTEARNRITRFRLLLMMEANTSIMLCKMWLYISTISMACLYSTMTSSSRSSSSSYSL